jgi:[acyl-carrier-protein] S-malonyltransferase
MGRAFYESSSGARAVFEEVDAALGFALTRVIFEGPEAELQLTANTQPAVLTVSVAAARAAAERGLVPALVAGHSLGEYSALVVAGALRLGDAVRVVRRRGELMQAAVPVGAGAMAAIMGLALDVVEGVCAEASQGEVVGVANINSPGQTVIAGHRDAVERAVKLAGERGGRKSVLLPVSAPFHCALMAPAAEGLAPILRGVPVADPRIPVVRNADAGVTRAAADVVPYLLKQVASPVRWTECVRRLALEGATAFVEVGPGRVLTTLTRRIAEGSRGLSVEDPAGLDRALAELGALA